MDICEGHLELTWKIQANLPPLMDLNYIQKDLFFK